MKKLIFWVIICIYTLILLVLASMALSSVKEMLVGYEAAQPELVVQREITRLQKAAADGKLGEVMTFPDELKGSDFAADSPFNGDYVKSIAQGKLTYEISPSDFSSDGSVYNIKSDGKLVAKMTLKSSNERTEMIFFNASDWSLASIDAAAKMHQVQLNLPKDLTVTANGIPLAGAKTEDPDELRYSAAGLSPISMSVSDKYGHTLALTGNANVVTKTYTVTVPTNYTVTIAGGEVLSSEGLPRNEYAQLGYVKEYITDLPAIVTYSFTYLVTEDSEKDITITDEKGNNIPCDLSAGSIEFTDLNVQESVPEEILAEINVMNFAETWSKFMTRDLTGAHYGFDQAAAFMIKDSYLYNVAWSWATGIDITFTSAHTLLDPAFTDETMTNFIAYGDNCFSCDIHLIKHLRLTRTGAHQEDEMNSTLYFVRVDDSDDGVDNPRWCVVDIQEIISAN